MSDLADRDLGWLAYDLNRLWEQMHGPNPWRQQESYIKPFNALTKEFMSRPEYKSREALFSSDEDVRKITKKLMELEEYVDGKKNEQE